MFRRHRIEVKNADQLQTMRAAGVVVADALAAVQRTASVGVRTADLDAVAAAVIAEAGATSNFLGYFDYPATICVSINDEVVHGIPGERVLADGDLVSIDCGAIVDGWHSDAAVSFIVGTPRSGADVELIRVTEQALWAGIDAMRPGARLGDVSHAIGRSVRAHPFGYGIVEDFVGHGIGSSMHMAPDVPNSGRPGRGPVLQVGMTFALEPMITLGTSETTVDEDGWTARTADGSRCAHVEHTVAITEAGPWVLSASAP